MRLLPYLSIFWFLHLALVVEGESPLSCIPRRTVTHHRDNGYLFREEGVSNYSTMLLREDLGLLVLGARGSIYALDLRNISHKNASVKWEVTDQQVSGCKNKGKDPQSHCKNYIRTLHTMEDGRMYVCGTNAYDPECDYMSYADGKLTLEKKAEDGKGKCPFDPFQRYASIMVGDDLYSATSMNFLGSEPVVIRTPAGIRTEFKGTWLQDPKFVSMAQMPESDNSSEGDDDKVYLFFSETAVDYDFYTRLVVSRVARVCKGDMGGERTLQKKWTSFLKAMVDCPVLEFQLPFIIQDTFLWCEPQQPWKSCLFFAVFTPQSMALPLSAVCVYSVSDISKVFSEGKYKKPELVKTSFVKWVMYSGDVPSPRPGACIDNAARNLGITQTLDLPDRTLQFIRDSPLMDQVILPKDRKPLLVWRGAAFTRIIVNQVQAANGEKHHVMFIGTEDGTMLKAVNYDGEMFIIEEVQLFQPPEPIKVLKFSNVTGHLYAGSEFGAVQIPPANCSRSLSCMDCVLARDPYCGWDKTTAKCTAVSEAQRELIQSVKQGDASLCPDPAPVKPVNQSMEVGGNLKLHCSPPSNLAKIRWEHNTLPVSPSARFLFLQDGLLIFNASVADAGQYHCLSVERSNTDNYTTTVAEYHVCRDSCSSSGQGKASLPEAQKGGPSVVGLQAVVGLLVVLLAALLAWNLWKGHLPVPWRCNDDKSGAGQGANQALSQQGDDNSSMTQQHTENKPLVSVADNGRSNNNHAGGEAVFSAAQDENVSAKVDLPSMKYIDDESEI